MRCSVYMIIIPAEGWKINGRSSGITPIFAQFLRNTGMLAPVGFLETKLVLTYNYKDGSETLTLQEIEAALSSNLDGMCPPFHSCCLWMATVLFLFHPFASVSGIPSVSDFLRFLSGSTHFYLFVSVSTPVVGATVGAAVSPKSMIIYYSFDAM